MFEEQIISHRSFLGKIPFCRTRKWTVLCTLCVEPLRVGCRHDVVQDRIPAPQAVQRHLVVWKRTTSVWRLRRACLLMYIDRTLRKRVDYVANATCISRCQGLRVPGRLQCNAGGARAARVNRSVYIRWGKWPGLWGHCTCGVRGRED